MDTMGAFLSASNHQLSVLLVCPPVQPPGWLSPSFTQCRLYPSISAVDWWLLEGRDWVIFILSPQGPAHGLVCYKQVRKCLLQIRWDEPLFGLWWLVYSLPSESTVPRK